MAMSKDTCLTCARAEWRRTKVGRLHPDGTGKCGWKFEPTPIPKAFYYPWQRDLWIALPPSGGYITRSKVHYDCPFFEGREVEE